MKTLTAHNASAITQTVIREHFLVFLNFTVPIRLSSRATVSFDGYTWTGANMELALDMDGMSGSIKFLNESFQWFDEFRDQGSAGILARVWMLYGETSTWDAVDDDFLFEGECGDWAQTDEFLIMSLEQPEAKFMPDIRISVANGFNHLPKPGTRFTTINGVIELGNSTNG